MKKATLLITALLLALSSFAQADYDYTIKPGWSWIAFLKGSNMQLDYAFASLNPEVGDVVKSELMGYAVYTADGWTGELTELVPKQVYLYFSCKDYSVNLTYPDFIVPTVTTATVTEATSSTAMGGGEVTDNGGAIISDRGVCWSTSPNPTTAGSHISAGQGMGEFACYLTGLTANTTYYYRAYATNTKGTAYGEELSFSTTAVPSHPGGYIDALFSIDANGRQVRFSQGNLQYKINNNTWRFAENQWDYVGSQTPDDGNVGGTVAGSDNSNISSASYNGWIDLFGWGTSGYNHGANCYQPWSTSETPSDYYAYGNAEYNLFDQTGQADWGYNAISNATINGSSLENQWRTLTMNEWRYVLHQRTTASGIRYAKAQVNGVNGLILVPDDWSSTTYTLNNTNQSEAHFDSNIITASDWATILEPAGCIFLPTTGLRSGTSVSEVRSKGCYWSSSHFDIYSSFGVYLYNSGLSLFWYYYPYWGVSVRLIQDVSQSTATLPTVTTTTASDITSSTATSGGEVTDDGDATVTARGVCWSTSANPTTADCHTSDGTGTGSFASTLTGLNANTTYYYRAYATNSEGTAYGEELSFSTTASAAPTHQGGVIDGLFSVSATSQVRFSQGNLQYIGSASTPYWKFADYQWDCIGESQASSLANVDRDLFCWGTSGYNHGANYYQPWQMDFERNGHWAYGNQDYDLSSETGQADWGYNAISNGGNQENRWRTLSNEEWQYVFDTRATTSGIRYARATVNDVVGMIIVPDDWNTSTYSLNNTDQLSAAFGSNIITASDWTNTLEPAGCIFLPAAGWRSTVDMEHTIGVSSYHQQGIYWSSTHSRGGDVAYEIFFDGRRFGTNDARSRSNGYSVRLVQDFQPFTGYLDSNFTIDADHHQVQFAQGNLQYQASTNTWRFAEHQWDYVGSQIPDLNGDIGGTVAGSDNHDISSTYSGWIDLFGWGTSGYHDPDDPYNVNYQPWSISTDLVNPEYNHYGYGPSKNMPDPNLTGTSANYDWGIYNPISNGGNQAGLWRTLSADEWEYIIETRSTTSGIHYARATVNDVNGVILVPDNWETSTYTLNNPDVEDTLYDSNVITASDWNTILEPAGCVFLPCNGRREGDHVMLIGGLSGDYWSSTSINLTHSFDHESKMFVFTYHFIYVTNWWRDYGMSVRLVHDIE